jgi:N-acetylmuramoyl-L-alanine amidase CwlD
MHKRLSLLLLICLMITLQSRDSQAEENLKKVKLNCLVGREAIALDGFQKEEGTIYVSLKDQKLSSLCIYLGGILNSSPDSDSFTINRDNTTFTIKPGEMNVEAMDSLLTVKKNGNRIVLMKFQALIEVLKGHICYDKSKNLYYIQPIITGICADERNDELTITVNASTNVKYASRLEHTPERMVIDIDDIYIDDSVKLPENSRLAGASIEQIETTPASVRLIFPLSSDRSVQVQPRLLPQCVVIKIKNEEVAAEKKDQSASIQLNKISIENTKDYVRILVETSAPFSYQWSRLRSPDNRFFIDFLETSLVAPETSFELENVLLPKIRAAQLEAGSEGTTRLVLDLAHPALCEIRTNAGNPNQLIITIKNQLIEPDSALYCGSGTTKFSYSACGQIICIDPGHGGSDRGAYNRNLGLAEKEVTLDISKRLAEILRSKGWKVVLTRNSDRDVTYAGSPDRDELNARCAAASNFGASLFISVHINASVNRQANGFSTHWYKNQDYPLAAEIQSRLISKTGRRDRGVSRDRFFVLRNTDIPSVLVEAGFISNDEEAGLLLNEEYLQRVAEGIADGLGIYLCKTRSKRVVAKNNGSSKK